MSLIIPIISTIALHVPARLHDTRDAVKGSDLNVRDYLKLLGSHHHVAPTLIGGPGIGCLTASRNYVIDGDHFGKECMNVGNTTRLATFSLLLFYALNDALRC